MMEPTVFNIHEKMSHVDGYWKPGIAGRLNGQCVKLAKLKGEFVWHHHENEDELFMVVKGALTIRFRDRDVHLGEGDVCIVPTGVEHLPVADEECHVLLFEPDSTLNTGNVTNERTVSDLDTL